MLGLSQLLSGASAAIALQGRLLVVAAKAHGQQVFLGDLAVLVEQLGVNGEAAGAVPAISAFVNSAIVPGSGDGAEALAHHAERLPEQQHEAESIDQREKLREKRWHGDCAREGKETASGKPILGRRSIIASAVVWRCSDRCG